VWKLRTEEEGFGFVKVKMLARGSRKGGECGLKG
jgi:hypothetical protein